MSEEESFADGYMKGYADGLKEAWEELISMTSKGYTSREIQILAKSKKSQLGERIEMRRKRLNREMDIGEEPILEAPVHVSESKPEPQPEPVAAAPSPSPEPAPSVSPGGTYLLEGSHLDQATQIVKGQMKDGAKAMCIARTPPETLRTKHGLNCQMVWLTKMEGVQSEGDNSSLYLSPTDLGKLTTMIKGFLAENKRTVIMLEGLEYLVNQNDFKGVLKLLSGVRDQVFLAKGILLLPLDPVVFDPKDLKALERELQEE